MCVNDSNIVHTSVGPATGYKYVKRSCTVTNLQDETHASVCQCNYATFLRTKRTNQDDALAAKHPVISKQANTARNRIYCYTLHGVHIYRPLHEVCSQAYIV